MLQQENPDDYAIATGKSYSVKDFLGEAFSLVGLKWEDYVKVDPRFFRANEIPSLRGDATKAKEKLNWTASCDFKQLVRLMVEHDLKLEGLSLKDLKEAD